MFWNSPPLLHIRTCSCSSHKQAEPEQTLNSLPHTTPPLHLLILQEPWRSSLLFQTRSFVLQALPFLLFYLGRQMQELECSEPRATFSSQGSERPRVLCSFPLSFAQLQSNRSSQACWRGPASNHWGCCPWEPRHLRGRADTAANDQNKVRGTDALNSVGEMPWELRQANDLFQPKKASRKRWYLNWAFEDRHLAWGEAGKTVNKGFA